MFVLILMYLLVSVCGSKANTAGSSAVKEPCQQGKYCITLREEEITAVAGLCAVIPCSFTTDPGFTTTKIIWLKCATENANCDQSDKIINSSNPNEVVQLGFEGRVSLLEPDPRHGNCSIIINDLRDSDSGFYQLRVETASNGFSFRRKSKLSVNDLTQKPTVTGPPLTEGQETTLSCTAPGLCSGSAPEITWMWRGSGETEPTRKISAVSKELSLTFTPSAEHHGTNITCKVSFKNSIFTEKTETLKVTYLKAPVISGHTAVKLGDALNLTCSVDSFPPSVVTWTKLGSNKTLNKNTRTAELIIPYMTTEDVGKFICSASHQATNQTAHTEVNVTMKPSILNGSKCEVQSEVLTCVCISQGFPLPTIEWPLLKSHTQHCITTSTINNTINTNMSVSVKDHNYTTAVCVSRSEAGEVKEELKVVVKNVTKTESEKEEEVTETPQNMLDSIKQPQVIIAFLIGLVLSSVVCCSVQKCHRKKQKTSQILPPENLEMMDVDPVLVNGGRDEGGAEADEEQREVEYSDINLDLLKRGRPIGAERGQETSEYAEIKKDKTGRVQVIEGVNGEVMEGNPGEEMMVEVRKDDVAEKEEEEEEEEEEALYSNVKDLRRKV